MTNGETMDDTKAIERAEAQLRTAMLAGDADALDALLGEETVFTDPSGARMGKAPDLATHRSGLLRIERIDPAAPLSIRRLGDTAIACVTMELAGTFDGQRFGGTFAYTRVWHRDADGRWRVEAAHCSQTA